MLHRSHFDGTQSSIFAVVAVATSEASGGEEKIDLTKFLKTIGASRICDTQGAGSERGS